MNTSINITFQTSNTKHERIHRPPVAISISIFLGYVCTNTDVCNSIPTPIDVHSKTFDTELLTYKDNGGVRTCKNETKAGVGYLRNAHAKRLPKNKQPKKHTTTKTPLNQPNINYKRATLNPKP